MSLSKYPERLDLFQLKKDAAFDGDPNGDDVMADDINALQDAVSAIESTLGVKPQGNKLNVGERISVLEGSAALRVPSFLMYLGEADKINGATSVDEAVGHFVKFDHIVFGNNADDITSANHDIAQNIITNIKGNRDIKIYGYIDCSVNTVNLSVSDIQIKIQAWRDMGVDGIYCDNFGYESGVSRDRQNQILDSIHQYGLVAILQAADSDKLLTDAHDDAMNPNWITPHIQDGDIYHYQQFAVNTASTEFYLDTYALVDKMRNLYNYRLASGVRIFATPYISSNIDKTLAQQYYEWAHVAALLTSVDAFHPVIEGNGKLNNLAPSYNWIPIAGNWYTGRPVIETDTITNTFSRETVFGKVILDNANHTYKYEGLYIPYELLRIAANSIDGSLLMDGTIEDTKIKSYDGNRLISAINADQGTGTIDIKKISTFGYDSINADGSIPVDVLKANVVDAINAYIGTAVIEEAMISDLHASKITAGDIDAERLQANIVQAINLYARNMTVTSAQISEAVIGDLHANKITAGDIAVERLQANVVNAINVNAQGANIQNLTAENITAGDIGTDRLKANVINAINAYADTVIANRAFIKAAAIGQLEADNIKASVITAINLSAETAKIDSAKITELDAAHIQASVIDAINANISGVAKINGGVIQDATIGGAQISEGSITDAHVIDLDAGKISAGTLDTAKVTIQGDNGMLRLAGNRIQVFDNSTVNGAYFERVSIGDINGDGTTYGFQVRGSDGTTVLYDERGVYNEGITDGAITNPKIGTDEVDGRVIKALSITADHIQSDSIISRLIASEQILAQHIQAGTITAGSAIIADEAIGSAMIGKAQIDDSHIKSLNADKIVAGTIKAEFVQISSSTTFADGYNPATIDTNIRNDLRMTAPLPTSITMDSDGITASSSTVLGAYARFDYRGLYIKSGAIVIENGLSFDNLSSDVQGSIDKSSTFVDSSNDINTITPSEKIQLKKDWTGYQADYTSITAQCSDYWPTGTTPPASQTNYINAYNDLNTFLNTTPDTNNNKAILAADNLSNSSSIDGTTLTTKTSAYLNAKASLQQDIAIQAKALADAAQAKANDIENNVVYKIEIVSSNGIFFRNGIVNTVLQAYVYRGANDITDTIDASNLIWSRVSSDPAGDIAWNTAHSVGSKSITITKDDIVNRATFDCKLLG